MGDINSSVSQFYLSLAIKKVLGPDKLETVQVMFDIVLAHNEKHYYDKALRIFEAVVQILQTHLDKDDVKIAYTLYNMGLSYIGKCDHKLAIKCFEESLNIKKKNNIVSNSNIDGE